MRRAGRGRGSVRQAHQHDDVPVVRGRLAIDLRQARHKTGLAGSGEGEVHVWGVESRERIGQVVGVEARRRHRLLPATDGLNDSLDGLRRLRLVARCGFEGDRAVLDEHSQARVALGHEADALDGGGQVGGVRPYRQGRIHAHQVAYLRELPVEQTGRDLARTAGAVALQPDEALTRAGVGDAQRHALTRRYGPGGVGENLRRYERCARGLRRDRVPAELLERHAVAVCGEEVDLVALDLHPYAGEPVSY